MKFPLLSIGQRFEYQGHVYTKVSPLIARDDHNNARRFFARSADVTLLVETAPAPQAGDAGSCTADAIVAALDDYHAQCLRCLDDLAHAAAPDAAETARKRLERARRKFLRQLRLPG
jgi:hypothetical protein